jgi:hypothetical protein
MDDKWLLSVIQDKKHLSLLADIAARLRRPVRPCHHRHHHRRHAGAATRILEPFRSTPKKNSNTAGPP